MAILIRLGAILGIVSSALFVAFGQSDEGEIVRQAVEAYEAGQYGPAIEQYESLLDDGYRSFELYYNLGNAYYESGQIGKALVNYLRAEAIKPRDSDLDRNIVRVRVERVEFQRDEHNLVDRVATMSSGILTMGELRFAAVVIWAGFYAGLIIFIVHRNWRRKLVIVLITLGIIATIANLYLFARTYSTNQRPPAVVTSLKTTVYSGPDFEYLPIYELHMATELRILEQTGAWVRFVLPDGKQGWVNIEAIEKV